VEVSRIPFGNSVSNNSFTLMVLICLSVILPPATRHRAQSISANSSHSLLVFFLCLRTFGLATCFVEGTTPTLGVVISGGVGTAEFLLEPSNSDLSVSLI